MPSSTSSSEAVAVATRREAVPGVRSVVIVIALLVVLVTSLELVGRIGFVRVSRIQRRIASQYDAAVHLQPVAGGKPTLLVVGNSLMLLGLDMPTFDSAIGSAYHPSAFFVEQTEYLDWYYGLRRLFREGSRPSVVVLGLSTNHLVSNTVRGEYFARFLMDTDDFPEIAAREKLDPTTASTWLFANLSGWIGGKAEIRNWVFVKTFRDMDKLGHRLQTAGGGSPDPATFASIGRERLNALQALCRQYGARFVFVLPPTNDRRAGPAGLQARDAGMKVPVVVPFAAREMPAANYIDEYHLDARGARLFSRALGHQLVAMLTSQTPVAR